MDKRKEMRDQYKQREVIGGVYRIVNKDNNKYLLLCGDDIKGAKNQFEFSMMTGSCVDMRLQRYWGDGKQFAFEVLEELMQKPEQTKKEFMDDLAVLREIWQEKFDAGLSY